MSAGTRLSCPQKPVSKAVVWVTAGVVVAAWGVNFVFAKEALNQFDVGPFNFIRFASMAVLGWVVLGLTGGVTPVSREHRGRLVAVAVVGFCGYVFGFSVGLSLTSAFSASLLLALVPLFVMLFTSLESRNLPAGHPPTGRSLQAIHADDLRHDDCCDPDPHAHCAHAEFAGLERRRRGRTPAEPTCLASVGSRRMSRALGETATV